LCPHPSFLPPSLQIATFDQRGVSGHPNHIATCLGVLQATRLFAEQSDDHDDSPSSSSPSSSIPLLHGDSSSSPSCSSGGGLAGKAGGNKSRGPLIGVVLDSTNLFRKFLGPVDVALSLLLQGLDSRHQQQGGEGEVVVVNSQPWRVYEAMAAHHTQFVWYRRLFVCFSRFTFVNSFKIFHKSGQQ
jgi:hypothetical protein